MSEAKHTKGPWQRSGIRVKLGAEDCLRVGPDGFPIAFVPIGRTPKEHAEAIADSYLIAAAPELFVELSDILRSIEGGGDVVTFNEVVVARYRALINKATGAA